jgi:hypothetical protein
VALAARYVPSGAARYSMNGSYWFGKQARWGKDLDVAQIDPRSDAIVGQWLTISEVAERLGLPSSRIKQYLRDRKLLGVQRADGTFGVPAAFLDGNQVVRGLHGTLTLLFDCGFSDAEAMRWLFTSDDSLPGSPIEAIAAHRCSEVNRRAQALAY